MRYLVIYPSLLLILGPDYAELVLTFLQFNLLVFATVCIAASGYIINDYFDIKIDKINKPDNVIVGKKMNRRMAITAHWILTVTGLITALLTCYYLGLTPIFMIFIFTSGALWFYSTSYKHTPLIGNIIIAFLAALVPLVTSFVDVILINKQFASLFIEKGIESNISAFWVLAFAGFAFLFTLIRELIKDLADMKGDQTYDSQTVPIAWGEKTAKAITIALYFIAFFLLLFLHKKYLKDVYSLLYILVLIIVPSLKSAYIVYKANKRSEYKRAGNINKIVSVFGILFSVLFYVMLTS